MELYILASGSSGNSALVTGPRGHLLIDAGISMRRICTGLRANGVRPEDLAGILITHAHSDHVSGLKMMTKYYRLPIYCTDECAGELCRTMPETAAYITIITPGEGFTCAGLDTVAFSTPHDSPGSVGWRLDDGVRSLAFVTDLGYVPRSVAQAIKGAHTVVLEANHDINRLMSGPYPHYLKERILSRFGHLCNEDSGRLAVYLAQNGTQQIILAHLSGENNLPMLALQAVSTALEAAGVQAAVSVAKRSEYSERVCI